MSEQGLLGQVFVYLAAAVVAVPLAKRLGLGAVLGYLVAGVAIGPYGLGLVGHEGQDVLHFAELGVVMMLFLIGLELEPARLWQQRGALLGLGGLQIGVTAAVLAAAAVALGLSGRAAFAVGLILAMSSTAIVLQSLAERGLERTDAGERSFAVLLFQDLAVIPLLALLPLLTVAGVRPASGGEPTGWLASLPAWGRTLATLGAVGTIVLAGRWFARPAFRAIARTGLREAFTASALLVVVGIALLMTQVGLSPALGTFLAGVVLAGSEFRHELESDIEPFKGLLLGLFFLAVGASIDFALVGARAGVITALVVGLIGVKFLVLLGLGRLFRMALDQRLLFAVALAQGGEFCFVLLSFAAQQGVLDAATANALVATVALSMAATPLLLVLYERLVQPRFGCTRSPEREADTIDQEGTVILAGFGAFGSIVGRLLVANGVRTTVLDHDSDHVDLLRRLGVGVFYGDASRLDLLRAAGAERARLLIVATGDRERTLEIVRVARTHFPGLTLLARAHSRPEAYDLIEAGVQHVFRESFDSSLRLGVEALRMLGFRAYQAHRAAQLFRRYDERALRDLVGVPREGDAFLSRARASLQMLERLLQDQLQRREAPRDAAWDTESLRAEYRGRETEEP